MAPQSFQTEIGGRVLTIEVGRFAQQASAACTVRYGDTVVLATAVMGSEPREGIDYFPLLVDYEERLYAAGKIKGSRFIKREGRPTDEAILTARVVDRSVRPLFEASLRLDVQVVLTVLSVDGENDADIPSLIGASAALALSDIPWAGPIAAVRVGIINGEWVLNPTYAARDKSDLDLVVAGSADTILMVEAGGNEVPEDTVLAGLAFAQKHLKKVLTLIEQVVAAAGQPKRSLAPAVSDEDRAKGEALRRKVEAFVKAADSTALLAGNKSAREAATAALTSDLDAQLKADSAVDKDGRAAGVAMLQEFIDAAARRRTIEEGIRVDGRKPDEIRPLSAVVGLLPRTHGSGLFQRGETQVLSIVTLGAPGDEQVLDTMEESGKKRYMHHYNFPGFSTGEVKPVRSPGRREVGHGALAEKAIEPLLPSKEAFPYTIRVVSEVLSSNGSTSQASVCGSVLALLDAGVPLRAPCAGISMGLMRDEATGRRVLLTDIQGLEDHAGDMDFKVAGTKTGITAIQMDVKTHGLSLEVCQEAIVGARAARQRILQVMAEAIPEPRPELSPFAPRITALRIPVDKIREVIGRGGETINKIIDECGGIDVTKIDIEDDGLVMVTSHNAELAKKAVDWIKNLTREVQPGEVFEGPVTQIVKDRNTGSEIGAVVELFPGHDGMVHISELAPWRIATVSEAVQVGDRLKVVVVEVDRERGRVSLSAKRINSPLPRKPQPPAERGPGAPFDERPHGRGFRGGRPGGGRAGRGAMGGLRPPAGRRDVGSPYTDPFLQG